MYVICAYNMHVCILYAFHVYVYIQYVCVYVCMYICVICVHIYSIT